MALKDLKSDLSKFRMPKKEPLQTKERVSVNKNLNKTPLSSMAESAPKIPRSTTTVNKEGVNPQKVNQSEKFKGETTPQPMDNSSKFKGETTPKPMSLEERYLGQTEPTLVNQSEKFLGETTPSEMNNQSQFLGETSPKEANNSQQFLGETTPKEANNKSQFLGETTPKEANNKVQFLGETTPNESDRSSKFLGETTPVESDRSSKFLGETTPNESDRSSKFLGETTPNEMNNQSQFLGETTPLSSDRSSKFLGETTPNESDKSSKFLGETTPSNFTFSGKLENEGKEFREVNNITDIHAKGFNSRFGIGEHTKFVGVDKNNTLFDGASSLFGNAKTIRFEGEDTKFDRSTSLYGNFDNSVVGLSFTPGYGSFKRKTETGPKQRYNPDTVYRVSNELTNKSISQLQEMRSSPSFLDEMYSKYNLKDDSFNRGLGLFRQPFILRGIQRRKVSKGEPQKWGIGGFTYDEGAIRGGIVTSTVRALVDVARIGSWFASVPGILWGAKQFGMQRSQKFGKVWTPVGMLAAIGGQHVGLKAQRPGLIPLVDDTFQYQDNTLNIVKDKLETIYKVDLFLPNTLVGAPFVTQTDTKGGFNSLYGINIMGPGFTTRGIDTFDNQSQREASSRANHYQWYTPVGSPFNAGPAGGDDFNTYGDDTPLSADEAENFGLGYKLKDGNFTKYDDANVSKFDDIKINTNDESHPLHKLETSDTVKHYETIAYGNIPTRGAVDKQYQDFRSLLTGVQKEISEKEDYEQNNISKKYFGGQDPSAGTIEDRIDWTGTSTSDNNRWDVINALAPQESEKGLKDDLVPFYIQPLGSKDGKFYQFRGAISGLTETFSPSWDSIKFSGRADQGYKYGTFERSLSFNFQVYATSRIDMKPMYEKLQALSTFTMPEYKGIKGYQGILVKMTLGDLYKNKLSFIDSLTYTISDDVSWDTNSDKSDLGVMPMGIDVAIGFKILDDKRPQYLEKVYDLKWEK